MKPIILLPYAGTSVGGSYVSSAQVAGYIQRHFDYEYRVLLPEHGTNEAVFRREGLTPYFYGLGDDAVKRMQQTVGLWPKLHAFPAQLRLLKTAVAQLRQHQPHLVHINDNRTFIAWALAARRQKIPVLWHVRGMDGNPKTDWLRLKLSDYLIFVADGIRLRLPRAYLVPNQTIYNAVDFNLFSPTTNGRASKQSFGWPADKVIIGLVANLIPRKRPEWAVQVAIDLLQRGHGIHFVWCGADPSDGAYTKRLQQMVVEAEMTPYFHFLGFCPEVEKVMQAIDILLLTSTAQGEAFPRVVIEAMACSTAVVTTRCGGVAEAIENGRNGLIVEADDFPTLLNATEQLITQPDYRHQLAQTAVADARARFSLSHVSQQVKQVYDFLLGASVHDR